MGNGQLGQSYEFPNVTNHRQLQGSQLRDQQNQRKMSIERRKINQSPGLVMTNANSIQQHNGGTLDLSNKQALKANHAQAMQNYLTGEEDPAKHVRTRTNPMRQSRGGSQQAVHEDAKKKPGQVMLRFTPDGPSVQNKFGGKKTPQSTQHASQPAHLQHRGLTQSP